MSVAPGPEKVSLSDLRAHLAQAQGPVWLRNARVPSAMLCGVGGPELRDGLMGVDILIADGRLGFGAPAGPHRAFDLGQRIVFAGLVDCHTHIDKGQVWPRSPNPDGSFLGAVETAHLDAPRYGTESDLRARAAFMLGCAYAHGTVALRTHLDADPERLDMSLGVLHELAAEWRDRIALQICPFLSMTTPDEEIEQIARTCRDGILSIFLQQTPDLPDRLAQIFKIAQGEGLDLDVHADENLDPNSHCLRAVAKTALRHGFEGRILVGHGCALSVQPEDELQTTLDLAAEAGLGVVALPLCNVYLQDRGPGSPRQRGIAPVKEIAAAGIPVAIGSDNTRDAFYAYGDLDMVENFRDAMRMMQLDHPVGAWPGAVSTTPAALIGRPELGVLQKGGVADLVILDARNWSEFAARPAHNRIVLREGVPIDTTPPDYAVLDALEGMDP